jgi:hypothetical protein
MDITHIKSMERDLVWIASCGLGIAYLAIFLGLGELGDDWNA